MKKMGNDQIVNYIITWLCYGDEEAAQRVAYTADESALDVIEYGVIVEKGRRRGLLLPNLDGVDSVEQQIYIAKQKAGIPDDDDEVTLYRFRVTRHE